ncbi:hypothetical protein GCM10022410_13300 [Amphibacillus indicireducens]|uniref:O-antigen polysaccharide polymerase Wzy n=2 Tax=Amphibacillus indicireducens TaxID=1076330 RepID=A0ABP7VK04_9BACI
MKGSRGALFRPLLFIVWYYALLGKKLSTKTSILAVVLTPIVSNLYVFFREGGIVIKSFLSSFYTFLYSQGVTAVFFANFLDYRDGFSRNTRFYFLSGFIEPVRRYITQRTAYSSGRSQRFVDVTYSLDHKLMHEISPELYAQGVGFGSNIVAEFYAFGGYIGIAILTILLCYLINLFENKSRINRVMLIVSFYWVQNLIWAPRGTMLPNPIFILLSLIIYYFINTVVNKNDGNFKKSKEGVS